MKLNHYLLALSLCFMCCGATCRNQSTLDTVYKSEGTLITTVDSAMQAWSDYVKRGLATQSQVDVVKAAYIKYYNAQQIAKVGLHFSLQGTNAPPVNMADVQNAEIALIQLVTSFLNKKV